MARTRKPTWRLPCFALGAALGITLTVYTMRVRLEGVRLACDSAVGSAFLLGCTDGRRAPEDKCHQRWVLFEKDFQDITQLRQVDPIGLGYPHQSAE